MANIPCEMTEEPAASALAERQGFVTAVTKPWLLRTGCFLGSQRSVPDQRKHRGPHPEDGPLFAPANWPDLRCAVSHLSWLLTRAYAWESALKLVGDRFRLNARQRLAVQRSACSDQSLAAANCGESFAASHRRTACEY